jgi:peroxiredoxin
MSFLAIPLAFLASAAVAAEPIQVQMAVTGRKVEVQVHHADGGPASGVSVRLLYGRQLTEAVARTDAQGRWSHTVSRTGAYEAVVETEDGVIRESFVALDEVASPGPPRFIVFAGLGCLLAGVGLGMIATKNAARIARPVGWVFSVAIGVLLVSGGGLLAWSALSQPRPPATPDDPDVAAAARDFLRGKEVKPLSKPLERLLANPGVELEKSQPHPLLGKSAPDFALTDHLNKQWRLRDRLDQGPVVLVFYYGYHCNHCVGQLFALHDDIAKFRELGAEVLAISADPPELTQQRFKKYGPFAFPVLADAGNKVAQAYGVFRPASGKTPEELQHGTFVLGRDGKVHWAQYGNEPFTGNVTLLHELARLQGRSPSTKRP